jgi:hypothetical protein
MPSLTADRFANPASAELTDGKGEAAAFYGFWQCQILGTGLSCTQASDIGTPSAEDEDFLVIQTHSEPPG